MSEKPTPQDMVEAMMQAAAEADSVADTPAPGTFAKQYADAIKDEIHADNVEAFLHGAATVNLLIQEAIMRATLAANESASEADSLITVYLARAAYDGAAMVASIMAANIDALVQGVVEGPAFDRQFNKIISNF